MQKQTSTTNKNKKVVENRYKRKTIFEKNSYSDHTFVLLPTNSTKGELFTVQGSIPRGPSTCSDDIAPPHSDTNTLKIASKSGFSSLQPRSRSSSNASHQDWRYAHMNSRQADFQKDGTWSRLKSLDIERPIQLYLGRRSTILHGYNYLGRRSTIPLVTGRRFQSQVINLTPPKKVRKSRRSSQRVGVRDT